MEKSTEAKPQNNWGGHWSLGAKERRGTLGEERATQNNPKKGKKRLNPAKEEGNNTVCF